jgi:chromosomal replication initiator protein
VLDILGVKKPLRLVVNRQLSTKQNTPSHQSPTLTASGLIPKYTFSNFVIGSSNQFAHAASVAVANQPGESYNPLFLYGGVGLGKTHLANAIGHTVLTKRPDRRVFYIPSESFMNELISCLRHDRMDAFKSKYRSIDTLILDDIQFIAGKERTQEEFFHTFNSLYESRRQIVITSDRLPREIAGLEDRLRTRFEWGLIADIQAPDMETRVAIIQKKAALEGISLPMDVAVFLATHIDSNVRELEGSLTRVTAFASLYNTPISIDLTREVLQNTLNEKIREITVESIQKAVCNYFNIKPSDLKSKRRARDVAFPRHLAMYLCRKLTSASFPTIGNSFGGRDHSTVIHASVSIEKKLQKDPTMQATIAKLEKTLRS